MESQDLTDHLHSLSFTSTTAEIKRSTSFSSSTTTSTSSHFNTPLPNAKPHAPSFLQRPLSLSDLHFTRRLGSGDMSAVYLAVPKESAGAGGAVFAAKVMEKEDLARRNKEGRARTEREILEMLDHPFLPTLYAFIHAPKWLCFLTPFCPGGDLHVLRQRFPNKRFLESAVRFYASEVLLALEYLHMLGVIYRDLKPENVLIRSDGHIMLTDFDLSLKCDDSTSTAQIISDQNPPRTVPRNDSHVEPTRATSSCMIPNCIAPTASCFHPKRKKKKKQTHFNGPAFVAEPVNVRSMSFVGTHEYLAPEIVSGEGHGSAVDWWTLGIFMFELFYGVTPFKGMDHELTLANVVARALEFPKEPAASAAMKELISQLLIKDPAKRLGSVMGASAIKHHPFFQGVNWALLRCTTPPFVPPPSSAKAIYDDHQTCPEIFIDCY
ncbi:serine/threonine-protein kinase D6PKL2-like [Glycine soja]|uniref:non-specific serine/threonine protein kinase n=1 Tax=Glycine soja TaxID=3848 RepID=A0A445HMS2_GLYSO|nr:serine/threonine-protein kinase D6PKL2-like [Glycine soja]RZB74983.1 Serine/threonine-protein kinase D6PKL2 [Glycine soja]